MNPNKFEKELNNGLCCDTLLAGCEDVHLGEAIHHRIYVVITPLNERET